MKIITALMDDINRHDVMTLKQIYFSKITVFANIWKYKLAKTVLLYHLILLPIKVNIKQN